MKRMLFVCIENTGRSPVSEAFARHYVYGKRVLDE